MDKKALKTTNAPAAVGMGLIALDVVINGKIASAPRFFAGGTCGNVLAILAYLGWKTTAVARFGNDPIARRIINDLKRWGVGTEFARLRPSSKAPVILEKIGTDRDGQGTHRFSFTCPECGVWFPGFSPVPVAAVEPVLGDLAQVQVFFFDRPSRSSLRVAEDCRKQGACICFEPSSVGDPKLFREAVELAHIVKYSSDRLSELSELKRLPKPLIEIGTLGNAGLRFRSRIAKSRTGDWRRLQAFAQRTIKDAAGSGDWLTAVLLDRLARDGVTSLKSADLDRLFDALLDAQAAASWNCTFEAARGGMNSTSLREFWTAVGTIRAGSSLAEDSHAKPRRATHATISTICLSCREPSPTARRQKAHVALVL